MKTTTALSLGTRLVGLVLGVRAFVYLPMIVWGLMDVADNPKRWPHTLSMGLAYVLSVAAAWLLFRYADVLAARFVSCRDEIGLIRHEDPSIHRDILQLALRIIGAVCVAFSIPQIVGQGVLRMVTYSSFQTQLWSHLVPGIISLAVGVYLLKGGALLVNLAYGHKPDEPASDNTEHP